MRSDPPPNCPHCGWPDAEPVEIVSRHATSEGVISYSRCRCGRLQVRRNESVVIRAHTTTPGGSGDRPQGSRVLTGVLRAAAAVPVALLVATGAVTMPAAALVACLAVGTAAGALAAAWAWLTTDPPNRNTPDVGLLTGAMAMTAALALAGMVVLLGPGAVVVIPAIYTLAAVALWYRSRWRPPAPFDPTTPWPRRQEGSRACRS